MKNEVVNHILKEILEAHGLACAEYQDWIVPNGEFPVVSMTWFSKPKTGVLQVDVQLDKDNVIQECFGGIGTGDEGLNNAVENFCINSLHVMLAALWAINDADQVETEKWTIGDHGYTAYLGNFGTKALNGEHPGIPENAFSAIESAIKETKLTGKLNWFRNYYGSVDRKSKVYESLHNNDNWQVGEDVLKGINWIQSDNFYSVRIFIILVRQTEQESVSS